MKVRGVILIAWWLYVYTLVAVPSVQPGYVYMAWNWVPRERFLNKDFCELKARQLSREGQQASCQYVND